MPAGKAWRCCRTLIIALAVVLPATARASCKPAATVRQIAPGVFVRPGHYQPVFEGHDIANIGFIVGRRCVAVIDTGGSPAEGRALQCAIRQHTTRSVCDVILTHVHPDHILGSSAFHRPGVTFIGHQHLARSMTLVGGYYLQRLAQQLHHAVPASALVVPDKTVAVGHPIRIDLGQRILRIQAFPAAHTDSDLVVYDEATSTLWLSDLLFVEHVPVIDGSSKGWLAALAALVKQPAARAVPGHGPVSVPWPQAAEATRRYLRVLRRDVRRWQDQGGDLSGAEKVVGQSERGRWKLFDTYHKRNVIKVFTEMEWE